MVTETVRTSPVVSDVGTVWDTKTALSPAKAGSAARQRLARSKRGVTGGFIG
jgi:hypothetical protein